mmetsp:Transcript_35843/g.93606  ORF Transcript_35843/g.93606 Transcript_35843/m.93606 type:complete len:269 (-) Transcript_35843:205-1011(-)
MRENDRVASEHLLVVAEAAPRGGQLRGVVVLDEGARVHRIATDQPRQPPVHGPELAEVVGLDGTLQVVVEREVEGSHDALALAHVVGEAVDVAVPVLRHGERVPRGAHVLRLEPRPVTLHHVKADRAEADVLHHVADKLLDVRLHLRVCVIHGRGKLGHLDAGAVAAAAARHRGAVPADGPAAPVGLLEDEPAALRVLRRGAAVVDNEVEYGRHVLLVHGHHEVLQHGGGAVVGVELVPHAREVAVVVHGVGGRGEPDHVDARAAELR